MTTKMLRDWLANPNRGERLCLNAESVTDILAAIDAQGMPSEGPRPQGSGALSTGKPGPKDAPNPSPSPAAGR